MKQICMKEAVVKMSQKEDELARRVDAALASWRRGIQALERRWDAEGEDPDAEETVALAAGNEPELTEGRGDEPKARASKANKVTATASVGTQPKRARPSSGRASSYAGFVQRAQTFSAFSWFGKPEAIGKNVCAAHGWTNVDTDKLACASCKRELSFQEIEDSVRERGGDFQAAVREFRNAIERGHERLCPFAFSFVSRDLAQALLRRKKLQEETPGDSGNGVTQSIDHEGDAAERAEAMLARQMRLLAECKSETSAHAAHASTRKASLHSVP